MELVVGRVGRAHGVRGEVAIDIRTDDPERRFMPGARFDTQPAERGPLLVESLRWHETRGRGAGQILVFFEGVETREQAEALRGTLLVVDSATSAEAGDEEDFWDHDLIGLRAELLDGDAIGEVIDVLHLPVGEQLVVRLGSGTEALIPFVTAIVPTVEVQAGRIVIDPPPGLLDLED